MTHKNDDDPRSIYSNTNTHNRTPQEILFDTQKEPSEFKAKITFVLICLIMSVLWLWLLMIWNVSIY